jgi:hypothetical protein
MSQRSSRKRRRQRTARSAGSASAGAPSAPNGSSTPTSTAPDASSAPTSSAAEATPPPDLSGAPDAFERRYARSRAKDDAVRASLKPLAPGERPLAVTIGAIVAALLALANAIALALGYNSGDGSEMVIRTVVVTALLVLVAVGMWQAKYWAVLGMHTLLALMIIFAALALITAVNVWAAILMVLIIVSSGTLFWFLVKAMARIQMPTPPSQQKR